MFEYLLRSSFDAGYAAARAGPSAAASSPKTYDTIQEMPRFPSGASPGHGTIDYPSVFQIPEGFERAPRDFVPRHANGPNISEAPGTFPYSREHTPAAAYNTEYDGIPEMPRHPSADDWHLGKGQGAGKGVYNKDYHHRDRAYDGKGYENKGKSHYYFSRTQKGILGRANSDDHWRARDSPTESSLKTQQNQNQGPPMHNTFEELRLPDPEHANRLRVMGGPPQHLFAFRIQKVVLRQFFRSLNMVAEVEAVRHGCLLHDGIFLVCQRDRIEDVIDFVRSVPRSRHSIKARLRVLPSDALPRILTDETQDRLLMALRVIHNSPEDRLRMMNILHDKAIEEERYLPIPPELARNNAELKTNYFGKS